MLLGPSQVRKAVLAILLFLPLGPGQSGEVFCRGLDDPAGKPAGAKTGHRANGADRQWMGISVEFYQIQHDDCHADPDPCVHARRAVGEDGQRE